MDGFCEEVSTERIFFKVKGGFFTATVLRVLEGCWLFRLFVAFASLFISSYGCLEWAGSSIGTTSITISLYFHFIATTIPMAQILAVLFLNSDTEINDRQRYLIQQQTTAPLLCEDTNKRSAQGARSFGERMVLKGVM